MTLADYVQELNKIRLLSREEESVLWRNYKDKGDLTARRTLIESYQPLVFKQAEPFRQLDNIMDIIQEGTVGLIEATENYDYGTGVAFSLYAMHRIRGRMIDFVAREKRKSDLCVVEDADLSWAEKIPSSVLSAEERVERGELIGQVSAALCRLPARERTVLEHVFLHSEAAEEVASQMQLSATHIYRLQKQGIRRIRGMLSKFMHYWGKI